MGFRAFRLPSEWQSLAIGKKKGKKKKGQEGEVDVQHFPASPTLHLEIGKRPNSSLRPLFFFSPILWVVTVGFCIRSRQGAVKKRWPPLHETDTGTSLLSPPRTKARKRKKKVGTDHRYGASCRSVGQKQKSFSCRQKRATGRQNARHRLAPTFSLRSFFFSGYPGFFRNSSAIQSERAEHRIVRTDWTFKKPIGRRASIDPSHPGQTWKKKSTRYTEKKNRAVCVCALLFSQSLP